jgi:hypothetical protein
MSSSSPEEWSGEFSSTAMFLLDPDHRSDEGDIRLSVAGA